MNILRQNKNLLKPHWTFSQNGYLWRFFITSNDIVIGETRDIEKKIVYFFSLNLESGLPYFQNLIFEKNNYWVSIEGFDSGNIYLHRFENPNMPDHNGIIALDILNGETKWENKDLIYFFNTENEIYGFKQLYESFKYFSIDKKNGNITQEIQSTDIADLQALKLETSEQQYLENRYTEIFNPEESESIINEIILTEAGGKNIQGDVEYISTDKNLFFNYHTKTFYVNDLNNHFLDNVFCIFNLSDKSKIYQEKLNQKAKYNVPDSFFIHKNYLIFIKDKKEISTIKLD